MYLAPDRVLYKGTGHKMDDVNKRIPGFPGGLCLVSRDGEERLLYANEKILSCTGYAGAEAMIKAHPFFRELVLADDYHPLSEIFARNGEAPVTPLHFRMASAGGGLVQVDGILSAPEDLYEGKSCWCLHLVRTGYSSSGRDSLTGLPTPGSFYNAVQTTAVDDRKKGIFGHRAIIYFNLSNFKLYNYINGREGGNELIWRMAQLFRKYFPDALIGHVVADNFIMLAPEGHIPETIEALAEELSRYIHNSSITLKAGIFYVLDTVGTPGETDTNHQVDLAKIAADSIKSDGSRTWRVYDQALAEELENQSYVLAHFEEALREGYIRPYFQPVVRTLTGRLCSVEALARWEDPEKGLLSPGVFVPVLEKARLIHKLDRHIIRETARLFRFLIDNHRPFVPASVNLSRVDFARMDPLEYLENTLKEFCLPRDLFHVEVTESTLAEDPEAMKEMISRFQKAGFQCWLDDFGTGYSSLNMLQDYHFDEIKLDMSFQKKKGKRNRDLLRSIVLMAKNLGIHTLAEGVETKEQAEFLRNIGCEKIQGYHYGKPMAYEDLYLHCRDTHLVNENRRETRLMEEAGLINILTDAPVSIFIDDGEKTVTLFANKAMMENMRPFIQDGWNEGIPVGPEDIPEGRKFRNLLDKAILSGKTEAMTLVANNQYLNARITIIAGVGGRYVGKAEIYNISYNENFLSAKRTDRLLRNLLLIYDGLYHYSTRTDQVEIISSLRNLHQPGAAIPMRSWRRIIDNIHEEDRLRFKKFMDFHRQKQNAGSRIRHRESDMFRIRGKDGNYTWHEIAVVTTTEEGGDKFLICIRDAAFERAEDTGRLLDLIAKSMNVHAPEDDRTSMPRVENCAILAALKYAGSMKFFWKDKNRRFLGASEAFLKYYGITEKDILGKTDEDMGWHIDEENYHDIEEKVLSEGYHSHKAPGRCIIKGRVHRISACKVPVYRGNRIVGLLGYMTDLDDEEQAEKLDQTLAITDSETGLLTYRGMLMNAMEYDRNYRHYGEDYLAIYMHIPGFENTCILFGKEIRKTLIRKLVTIFSTHFAIRSTMAYLGSSRFMVFLKNKDGRDIEKDMEEIRKEVFRITHAEGCPVTLYLQYTTAHGSEAGDPDELLRLLSRKLNEKEMGNDARAIFIGNRLAFNIEAYDEAPTPVFVNDIDTHEILYMNKAILQSLGLPGDYDYKGKHCYELVHCTSTLPGVCPAFQLRKDRFIYNLWRNPHNHKDYLVCHAVVPWHGRTGHLEIAVEGGTLPKEYILSHSGV